MTLSFSLRAVTLVKYVNLRASTVLLCFKCFKHHPGKEKGSSSVSFLILS